VSVVARLQSLPLVTKASVVTALMSGPLHSGNMLLLPHAEVLLNGNSPVINLIIHAPK